jgi:amino-acid N-acetyltransferase
VFEGIRPAKPSDLQHIEAITRPLEREGVLVHRTRQQLEKDLNTCYVIARDDAIVATAMIKRFSDTHAEIACLCVHPNYRKVCTVYTVSGVSAEVNVLQSGRGDAMLTYLERVALAAGLTHVFVLSTRTMKVR